jgi:hypothetical protein
MTKWNSIFPDLIHAADGSWLAITRPGTPVRVGAWEATEDEAVAKFNDAYRRLETLVSE